MEGAMAAAHFKLDNLTAIIDRNGLQISGPSEGVMSVEDLAAKWTAFGWDVHEVNGNDVGALVELLKSPHLNSKPKMIIAKTTKGKGVSYMENQAQWHHKVPTLDQYNQAMSELNQKLEEIINA